MHSMYVFPFSYPYLKCGLSSIAITWELARNTESRALPPLPELEQMIRMHKDMREALFYMSSGETLQQAVFCHTTGLIIVTHQ